MAIALFVAVAISMEINKRYSFQSSPGTTKAKTE